MAASKWVAKNVLSGDDTTKKDLRKTFWNIEPVAVGECKLTLYCILDYRETETKFCEMCQTYHKRFYYNEDRDCSRCNMKAFQKRLEEHASVKKAYRKELIVRQENGG